MYIRLAVQYRISSLHHPSTDQIRSHRQTMKAFFNLLVYGFPLSILIAQQGRFFLSPELRNEG